MRRIFSTKMDESSAHNGFIFLLTFSKFESLRVQRGSYVRRGMTMSKRVGVPLLVLAVAVSGCGQKPRPQSTVLASAATYEYAIPDTSAKVALQVSITECSPSAQFKIEPQVTVAAVRGPHQYRLVGGDLSGWWTSHDLALASYETGALKTVNSSDADKTFAVVTNVIKGVASALAIAGAPSASGLPCSAQATAAIAALKKLKDRRTVLAADLQAATSAQATELATALAGIDTEIGRIATSDALRFELPAKPVAFSTKGGSISWDLNDIPATALVPTSAKEFRVDYCIEEQKEPDPEAKCDLAMANQGAATKVLIADAPKDCEGDQGCTRTIVMREPKRALLTLVAQGAAFGSKQGKRLKAVSLPVAQWGEYTLLSTSVGLAESRTVGFSLDEYGGKTSFAWKSDARAESITGGVASALEPGATLAGKIRDSDLTDQKAELDRLETDQKLRKARACKAILDAGGACPSS